MTAQEINSRECHLCVVGFPLQVRADGVVVHVPTQALGMIPVTPCKQPMISMPIIELAEKVFETVRKLRQQNATLIAEVETLRGPAERRKRLKERFVCARCKCKHPPDCYQVLDTTWREAGFQPYQFACLGCLIEALDRPLVLEDFTSAPINGAIRYGFHLGDREGWTRATAYFQREASEVKGK